MLDAMFSFGLMVAAPPQAAFDHAPFDRLLAAHVREQQVNYDAFARAPEFAAYLASFAGADPSGMSGPGRLAF